MCGQIFRTCALTCRRTCTDLILHNTVICDAACKPGCECPAGQVYIIYNTLLYYEVAASNKVGIHPVTTSSRFGNY